MTILSRCLVLARAQPAYGTSHSLATPAPFLPSFLPSFLPFLPSCPGSFTLLSACMVGRSLSGSGEAQAQARVRSWSRAQVCARSQIWASTRGHAQAHAVTNADAYNHDRDHDQ